MFGANDEQHFRPWGVATVRSPKWRNAYIARVRRIDRMVTKAARTRSGRLPIAAPKSYRQGLRALNAIYSQVARRRPASRSSRCGISWHERRQLPGGAVVNKVQSALRLSDGIHFTSTGELVIGTFVARQLATVYNVKLRPRSLRTSTDKFARRWRCHLLSVVGSEDDSDE